MTPYGYYGLTFNPFDKQAISEADHFESTDFKETLSRLNYLKGARGIGVITARPGMGKSYAIRCFAKSLNPNLFRPEYICLSTVSIIDFYKQLCDVLGIQEYGGKSKMFASIRNQIFDLYKEQRRPLILVIDEAQYLCAAILNDIKMLMNYQFDSINCLTLVLCGESYMNKALIKPVHEALRQRITIHYDFVGLSTEESFQYIGHKLQRAGGSISIIDDNALSAVSSWSQGVPRLIDNALSDALKLGAQLDKNTIDSDTIMAAINNQKLGG